MILRDHNEISLLFFFFSYSHHSKIFIALTSCTNSATIGCVCTTMYRAEDNMIKGKQMNEIFIPVKIEQNEKKCAQALLFSDKINDGIKRH